MIEHAEWFLAGAAQWLKLVIESIGILMIAFGVCVTVVNLARPARRTQWSGSFTQVRFDLARYLALGLEFQLAADVVSTAIAPSWSAIGKLAAIAVIRTGLNYFLMREMKQEELEISRS